jgi:hypothetical protein
MGMEVVGGIWERTASCAYGLNRVRDLQRGQIKKADPFSVHATT